MPSTSGCPAGNVALPAALLSSISMGSGSDERLCDYPLEPGRRRYDAAHCPGDRRYQVPAGRGCRSAQQAAPGRAKRWNSDADRIRQGPPGTKLLRFQPLPAAAGSPSDSINLFAQLKNEAAFITSTIEASSSPTLRSPSICSGPKAIGVEVSATDAATMAFQRASRLTPTPSASRWSTSSTRLE